MNPGFRFLLLVLMAAVLGWPGTAAAQPDTVVTAPTLMARRGGGRLTVAVYPLSALAAMYKAGVQVSVGRRHAVLVAVQGGHSDRPWVYNAHATQLSHTYISVPDTSFRQYSDSRQMAGWGVECQFRHYILDLHAQRGPYLGGWARVMQMRGRLEYHQETHQRQENGQYAAIATTSPVPDGTYRLWGAGAGALAGYQGIWGRLVMDAHLGFGANAGGLVVRGSRLGTHQSTAQNFMFGAENALVLKADLGIGVVVGQ